MKSFNDNTNFNEGNVSFNGFDIGEIWVSIVRAASTTFNSMTRTVETLYTSVERTAHPLWSELSFPWLMALPWQTTLSNIFSSIGRTVSTAFDTIARTSSTTHTKRTKPTTNWDND